MAWDHVIIDVEIQKTIDQLPRGWDETENMGVAVACVWVVEERRLRIYGTSDLAELRRELTLCRRVTGFNIAQFDLPVIFGQPNRQPVTVLNGRVDDILQRIWDALGSREKGWKLDDIVKATLNRSKIGDGADAPAWWQAGWVHKVINYCSDDCCLERDLCHFIDSYGYVRNAARVIRIPPWKAN